jgi:hypothetical protein
MLLFFLNGGLDPDFKLKFPLIANILFRKSSGVVPIYRGNNNITKRIIIPTQIVKLIPK